MSPFLDWHTLPEKEYISGFFGKMIHTERCTVAYWRVKAGSELPLHAHIHEQITNVLEGTFEMAVADVPKICTAGGVVVIPSNIPHGGRAITDCIILDIFQPARLDYQLGD
jgi:quercetin dioxygenase-like cupin family protein